MVVELTPVFVISPELASAVPLKAYFEKALGCPIK